MKKNTLNVRELLNKYEQNCDRISEIANACEKEQRERSEVETAEYNALVRENQLLQMRMNAAANDYGAAEAKVDADTILRENIAAGRQTEIKLCREQLNRILAHHTGQPIDKINEDTERDNFMTAQEALEYGLVDQVITSRKAAAEAK